MNKEENLKNTVSKFDKDLCLRRNSPDKVAMREISQDDTKMSNGRIEKNPPITIYDTSVPSQIQILKSTSERACHGSVSNGF
jgi:phosphomethylpyrimidine synthase